MIDVLIVEDNEEIGTLLQDFFLAEGYDVYHAMTGEEGLEVFRDEGAKVIVLDVMLPGMDGFEVCRAIREKQDVPIIIVSAKVTKEDKLNGLILGADDYIEKPYDVDILLAKVAGIMKRRYASNDITIGNIRLDKVGMIAYRDEKPVSLNKTEFSLLLYLMENRGKTLSKEKIFNHIWGADSETESQTVTVHIKWLREKLEQDPKKPEHIQTVWGVGYRFD
ncbi:DNA-binding response regulator, OmpR family, contains REC and winged-helix (wHTH) domain [Eubacterium ruminantium]|nr:DNA-binding response regulator, OmpR family, contains REC and winged-helix (wHTH) domain [Eubacterium ruminantium]